MDEKAKVMLAYYRELIETEKFDEYSIYGFLIFIRSYIQKAEYPALYEFCDMIAHRERDRGRAYDSIVNAKKNHYVSDMKTKHVLGYNGIFYNEWVDDLEKVGREFNIQMTETAMRDIVLCILVMAQYCKFRNEARFELFQFLDGSIGLTTTEGQSDSYFVLFCKVGPFQFLYQYAAGHINEPIEALRIDGKIRLKAKNRYII